jgi:small conductance mechanosensitive channel
MWYFLQNQSELKKIIPSVEVIKERIAEKESKVDAFFDRMLTMAVEYTPRVIMAILLLLFGLWLIRRIAVLSEKAMKRRDLDISLSTFLRSLISIGLKIILIVTVAGMLGIGTASFVTILGAAGLAVGLALQGSLSNFAGGVLILIFKPFRVGDTIEAGGQTGEVIEIQIFNTILLTGDHKTVILPNGPLSNGTIVNTTRHGDLRLDISLTVSSENNLEELVRVIREVLSRNSKVLSNITPGIFIGKVQDGAVTINVRPYCLPENSGELSSELYADFKREFELQKFRPAIPERIIHSAKVL